jgi:cell wall-associated NlpC family hydrolase
MIPTAQEISQRAAVVAEACAWIGTPYQHQADVKGAGVDCGMLLVRVFVDCGLVPPFDPRPYSNDWYMHRSEEKYLGFVLERVAEVEQPLFGDVAVFRHGRTYSHGGVVIGWPLIVHASAPAGCVVMEDIGKSPFADKACKFYSYWRRSGR